jgi:hypothetical protein
MVLIVHLKQYTIMKKPKLSFWQIWNLSFGFLGVQIGYSLQNGNTSRILEALGADVHSIGYFWLAAPLAGLIVQPIIAIKLGHVLDAESHLYFLAPLFRPWQCFLCPMRNTLPICCHP